jgi:hypothetical protein
LKKSKNLSKLPEDLIDVEFIDGSADFSTMPMAELITFLCSLFKDTIRVGDELHELEQTSSSESVRFARNMQAAGQVALWTSISNHIMGDFHVMMSEILEELKKTDDAVEAHGAIPDMVKVHLRDRHQAIYLKIVALANLSPAIMGTATEFFSATDHPSDVPDHMGIMFPQEGGEA